MRVLCGVFNGLILQNNTNSDRNINYLLKKRYSQMTHQATLKASQNTISYKNILINLTREQSFVVINYREAENVQL